MYVNFYWFYDHINTIAQNNIMNYVIFGNVTMLFLNIDVYMVHLWWPTFWCNLQFGIKIYYDLTFHRSIFLNIHIILMIYSPWNCFCKKPLKPRSKFLQISLSNLNFNWKFIWQLTVLRILKKNCQVKTSNYPYCKLLCKGINLYKWEELICTGEQRC